MFNAAKLRFDDIFENRLPEDEVREYLIELYERGETAAEIAGAASAMRDHLIPLPVHYDLKEKFRIIYYDGEAALALLRLYQLDSDPRLLETVQLMFKQFIEKKYDLYDGANLP